MMSPLLYGQIQFLQVSFIALRIMSFAPKEMRHQHQAAAAAGQIQTKLFITCQIPPPTPSSRFYLFNQVQVFPINVGVVQVGAWISNKKVCH